jgi:transcriptional regulator with XRE-family HTH domain
MPDSPTRGPLSARLAETYRQLRTSSNTTQAEFAELLEIDRERVQAIEAAGRANQTVDTIQSLAYALGLSAWQLLKIAEQHESLEALEAYRQANQRTGVDADLQRELEMLLEQKAERHHRRKRSGRKGKKSEKPAKTDDSKND